MRVSLVVKFAVPGYLEIPKSTLAPAETVLPCLSSRARREQRSREPGERDARAASALGWRSSSPRSRGRVHSAPAGECAESRECHAALPLGKRTCRPGRARLNPCRGAQRIDCGCQGLIQGAWVPSAEVLSARVLGGACWVSQGVAPLLGSPSTFSCLLPGVAEVGTRHGEGQRSLLGSGREAAAERDRGLWGHGVAT